MVVEPVWSSKKKQESPQPNLMKENMNEKPISKQVKWQRKMRLEGRCTDCGEQSPTYRCPSCNKKKSELVKAWKLANPERVAQISKAYQEKNKERLRLRQLERRRANREEVNRKQREYRMRKKIEMQET